MFSYEDEDVGKFSNLHWYTFKGKGFDATLMNINQEPTDLQNTFTKLKSDLTSSKHINAKIFRQLTKVERKCWANEQYSRRECLEISGIPDSISHNDLISEICGIFREYDADIDPVKHVIL